MCDVVAMRKGFSILEVLVVVMIVGLLFLITMPRLERPLASITAESEVQRLARAHMRARMVAVTRSRIAVLHLWPDSLTIGLVEHGDTVPWWSEPGPGTRNVTLTGPSHSVLVTPTTIGLGVSNGTWTVTYRGVTRSMVLSRLGRLRIVR
jgi:prepilin-type N-terminal cleavage/methylation domain-containing protein